MSQSGSLTDLLGYLADIGYRDLYLRAPGREPRRPETAARSTPPRATAPAPHEPRAAMPVASRGMPGATGVPPRREAADAGSSSGPATVAPRESVSGPEPVSPGDPAGRLEVLAREAAGCTRCRLAETRDKVVFGSGSARADLMFIGEGPGAQEDRRGLPFVGPAGELLTRIINAIQLDREQVYIANIVKCRPPRNRNPAADEVAACRGYLEQQIDVVAPKVIVLLGKVAAQTLLGTDYSLGRMRGQWYDVRGVQTRVTYHPAALLRATQYKRPTWEDMQIVRDRLRELSA